MNLTAEKSYRSVRQRAEEIRNDADHVVETMSPGDAWAQGDIAIVCLEALPDDLEKIENPSAQLAPGTTQGSRHCVDDISRVTIFRRKNADVLTGPIIDAPEGIRVTHPEHGDVSLPPGIYGIRYQRAYAEELRRVQD